MGKLFVVLASLFISFEGFSSGFTVGNGGDVVSCDDSSDVIKAGAYTRDFLFSDALLTARAPVASVKSSLDRIQTILQRSVPKLASSLREFADDWMNSADFKRARIWEPVPFALQILPVVEPFSALPLSCLNEEGTPRFEQAVIRAFANPVSLPSEKRLYKYNPRVLERLAETGLEQVSFLAIHEWLWDFSHEIEVNRRINVFLHRADIDELDPDEFRGQLKERGLKTGTSDGRPDHGLNPNSGECTGPSLTRNEIAQRFGTNRVLNSLGAIETRFLTRDLVCPDSLTSCDPFWKPNSMAVPSFVDAKMLLWYSSIQEEYPIKIVNLDLMKSGSWAFQEESALFNCKPPETSDGNLECTFGERGKSASGDISTGQNETYVGKWTRTCLNISARFPRRVEHISLGGGGGIGTVVEEVEALFSHSNRWPD